MKTKNLKTKVMSILLAIVMLLSMLPMSAFAAEGTLILDIDTNTNADFIKLPVIGEMISDMDLHDIRLTETALPAGGRRLQAGGIPALDAQKLLENSFEDGTVKDMEAAVEQLAGIGEKTDDKFALGMPPWSITPEYGLYLDYDDNDTFVGGGIYIVASEDFLLSQYGIVDWVPFYMGVDGHMRVYNVCSIKEQVAGSTDPDELLTGTITFEDYFEIDHLMQVDQQTVAYVGDTSLMDALTVRGGLETGMEYLYAPGFESDDENGLNLNAKIKFWIDALIFQIPIPSVNMTRSYGYYEEMSSGKATVKSSSGNPISQFDMTSVMMDGYGENTVGSVLQTGGWDKADPQLLELDDGRILLAYIGYDQSRSEHQRPALMLAVYEDGNWSQPTLVQDDGTADFEPTLVDAGDRVLLAWTSCKDDIDVHDADDQAEYLRYMEVYATFIDKDTLRIESNAIERLTDDNMYDSTPVASYDAATGDGMVHYLKSVVEDSFEEAVNPAVNESVVMYMLYDHDTRTWARDYYYDNEVDNQDQADVLIANWGGQRFLEAVIDNFGFSNSMADPVIVDFQVATYNGKAIYAYTVDEDGDLDKQEDRELFIQAYDFAEHKTYAPIRMTQNDDCDAMPRFASNGTYTYLFWHYSNEETGDQGINYLDIGDLIDNGLNENGTLGKDDYPIDIDTVRPGGRTDDGYNMASYRPVVDENGYLYVTWLQSVRHDDQTGNLEIYASALRERDSATVSDKLSLTWDEGEELAWTEPEIITESGLFHDQVNVIVTDDGTLITVSNQYDIDFSSDVYGVEDVKLVMTQTAAGRIGSGGAAPASSNEEPAYEIADALIEEKDDGYYVKYTVNKLRHTATEELQVVARKNDLYHSRKVANDYLSSDLEAMAQGETKSFEKRLLIPKEDFDAPYVHVFLEIRDQNGDPISNMMSFTLSHTHHYTYNATDGMITETCTCGHSETATVTASQELVYNGNAKEATVAYSDNWKGGELSVTYSEGGNLNAGGVTATVTKGDVAATVSYTIQKATVTITVNDATAKQYDELPQFSSVATGLIAGDTMVTAPTFSTVADMTEAGTFEITASGADAGSNYTITYVPGTLTVEAHTEHSGGTTTDNPQTGDNSHILTWIALLFISGGAVITLTVYDRKRRTANH